MTAEPSSTVEFETTVAAEGNNTGIVVPAEAVARLGGGKRPPVHVELNGYEYRSTVAVMGGRSMVGIGAAVRAATGLGAGDPIRVRLTLALTPREVDVPLELAAALAADDGARAFFEGLSTSLQRHHADTIAAAKTAETRQRRVEKALSLFRSAKPR